MSEEESGAEELGPVDYVLVEWSDQQPTGEAIPHLRDLVDRGLIRILDLAFIVKNDDGSVTELELSDLGGGEEAFSVLQASSAGLLDESDHRDAAEALEPGRAAALLIYENRWAAPFAAAVRRSGAQLVASGRIPVQDLLASLDATEQS